MASPRRTTQSLPLRSVPPHVRAAAATRSRSGPQPTRGCRRACGDALVWAALVGVRDRLRRRGALGDLRRRAARPRRAHQRRCRSWIRSRSARPRGSPASRCSPWTEARSPPRVAAVPGRAVRRRCAATGRTPSRIDIMEHQGWGYWEVGGRAPGRRRERPRPRARARARRRSALVIYEDAPARPRRPRGASGPGGGAPRAPPARRAARSRSLRRDAARASPTAATAASRCTWQAARRPSSATRTTSTSRWRRGVRCSTRSRHSAWR